MMLWLKSVHRLTRTQKVTPHFPTEISLPLETTTEFEADIIVTWNRYPLF